MTTAPVLVLLLAPSLVLAAKYDPAEERAGLRRHADAAYAHAAAAAGTPLEPAKAGAIKGELDQAATEAVLAESVAKTLETAGSLRAGEMENALRGKDDAAKALADDALSARNRWKKRTADQNDLKKQVDALPSEKPGAKEALAKAAGFLASADGVITIAENGAAGLAASAELMKSVQRRSKSPAGERKAADDEVVSASDALPAPAAEAKAAVDLLGQEPQNEFRTRAGAKLEVPRDLARRISSAADRACNRDGDFVSLSSAFDRALGGYQDAQRAADGKIEAARGFLDQAEAAQSDVRSRLAHN